MTTTKHFITHHQALMTASCLTDVERNKDKCRLSAEPGSKVYLEAQDDGPDKAEDEAMVAIDNVVRTHVLQVDPLLFKELQSLVHILQTVDTHPAFGGFWLQTGRK